MGIISVFTKQHKNVWKQLQESGRYTVKRDYIVLDMQEHADIIFKVYDWLVKNSPDAAARPEDAEYPVWVSFQKDTAMLPGKDSVLLELCVEETSITKINIAKWGAILNYSYIPLNAEDALRHKALVNLYGTDDVRAVITPFYPEINREIVESWKRLFDDTIQMGNDLAYGTIWEIKREWVKRIELGQE